MIAGWGTREVLASLSPNFKDTLHYAHVYVLSNSLCNSYTSLSGSVTDDMICAGKERSPVYNLFRKNKLYIGQLLDTQIEEIMQ